MASSVAKQAKIIKETAQELVKLCENPDYSDLAWYEVVGSHLRRLRAIHDGTFDLKSNEK